MTKTSLNRRQFMSTMGMAAATALTGQSAQGATPAKKPNVVMILSDDQGWGDVSCYGAPDIQTPHTDALVARGMRFDQFYANCPVCSPTRAALMTGRYPDSVGVPGVIRTHRNNNWGFMDPQATTLPQALKTAGYHTALVGKWHLGLEAPNKPNDRGFDHFHGWLGDMMDDYWKHRRHDINYMRLNEKTIDPPGHATDLFNQWAVDYIEDRKDKEDPFFLYLAYNAPHSPMHPEKAWLDKVMKREPDIDPERAKLVALIEHMDDGIGQVMQALEDTGALENTLVIFTSDNGGSMKYKANNGPYRDGKGTMYEGGIRVPMCAAWPGKIKPATRSDKIGLTMDLFPTICDAAGVKSPEVIEGRTMLPTLRGKQQPKEDRTLLWMRLDGGGHLGGRTFYAARKGDWKLMQHSPFHPMQLFNLKEDPGEQHPVTNKPGIHRDLFQAVQNHISECGHLPWQPPLL